MESGAHDTEHPKKRTKPSEKRAAKGTEQQNQRLRTRRRFWPQWAWGIAALVLLLIAGAVVWVVSSQSSEIEISGESTIPKSCGLLPLLNISQGDERVHMYPMVACSPLNQPSSRDRIPHPTGASGAVR
jgi:hypothetical protein